MTHDKAIALNRHQTMALQRQRQQWLEVLEEIATMKAAGEIDEAEAAVLGANILCFVPDQAERNALLHEAAARLQAKYPEGRVSIDTTDLPVMTLPEKLAEYKRTGELPELTCSDPRQE